jgi:chromosome segregation ATPase
MSTLISMSTRPGMASLSNQQAIPTERIVVVCPSCQATLSVRRVYLGHQILCKQCNHTFPLLDSAAPQTRSAFSDHNGAISKPGFSLPDINGGSRATVTEHDQLRTELDRHAAAHAHYKLRYEQVSEELSRVTADLDGIRAHLSQQLKQRDDDLAMAQAENGRLRVQLQGALHELDQSRTTLAERDQALRSENDQLYAAIDSLREALAFAEQEHINDLNRFKEQFNGAHEEGHDLVVSPVENDQLQAVRARVDDLERRLDASELINRDMVDFLEMARTRSIPV